MTTINQHVKLLRTGNMYSIDDPNDLGAEIARALVHFAKKHKADPARIIVHPDTLQGYGGELVRSEEHTSELQSR